MKDRYTGDTAFERPLTKSDIGRAIGDAGTLERGADYFQKRKVLFVKRNDKGLITGEVMGSNGQVYQVAAHVRRSADGRVQSVQGNCTCPVGYNCKHVAAVLLEDAAQIAEPALPSIIDLEAAKPPDVRKDALPKEVSSWLERLDLTKQETPRWYPTKSSRPVQSSCDAIFYVFRLSSEGRAEIIPYKGYVKKDGELGKNVRQFNAHQDYRRPGAGVSQQDAIILAQLDYFSPARSSDRYHDWPGGSALKDLLQQIIATGRARAPDIRGVELNWAGSRTLRFDWVTGALGDQKLEARDATGKRLVILPFPDPVYIDAELGGIGFAETDLPFHVVRALTVAPQIPVEAIASVRDTLSNQSGTPLPLPKPVKFEEQTDLVPRITVKLFGHELQERMPGRLWGRNDNLYDQTHIYPCVRAEIQYKGSDQVLVPGEGPDIRIENKKSLRIIRRDREVELQLLEELLDVAENFGGHPPDETHLGVRKSKAMKRSHSIFPCVLPGAFSISPEVLDFTQEGLKWLREAGFDVDIDPSWPIHLLSGALNFRTVVEPSGNNWFSVGLQLDVDGERVDLTETVLHLVRTLPLDEFGQLDEGFDLQEFLSDVMFYQHLSDGVLVPLPGLQLQGFIEAFLEVQGILRFHAADAARTSHFAEALDGCGAPWEGGPEILELGKRLRALAETPDTVLPTSLKADLRPYQKKGYGWLNALSESGFGGILADDMGLGKTVQTLSLLARRHLENKSDRPSLLVVPTSLITNWCNEVERFTPDLKLLCLHGPGRHERFAEVNTHDLVMTTYPLIHRDHEKLFEHDFDLAILDEAQAVKNPVSSVAKRIRDIRARQRLALTGTPLENNLIELWSLFDWLIPGFLGDRKGFAKEYRKPIEQNGDRARQRLLSSRVKPFLLRRTKDEVAEDLPPKTIIDETITLAGEQAALYESVRSAMDARVRAAVSERGLSGSRITVLDALLKLRQVCCDPKLVKLDAASAIEESAKRDRLREILEELVNENRKVLVFSQFVEMLRLIESDVQNRGWSYAMLHGNTRDRAAEIEKFQSGEAQLFLISLKAGGTGLNLTAADTVILYDPWWNPAVERQAMDRAHRIGQDKPVFVYRLYSANTVETAIQAMQSKKQALADALFEGGGSGALTLTEDDLADLFGTGGGPTS